MKISVFVSIILVSFALALSAYEPNIHHSTFIPPMAGQNRDTVLFPGEKHFANVQQLTFGGDNAEAYFSFDSKYIIYQRTNPKEGIMCDQIWMGKVPAPGE